MDYTTFNLMFKKPFDITKAHLFLDTLKLDKKTKLRPILVKIQAEQ